MPETNCKKIFIGNYKGGVGKTTSVYNIANNLVLKSDDEIRVLLIDLDPQSSLSEICIFKHHGGEKGLLDLKYYETLNYVFDMNIKSINMNNNLCLEFDLNKLIKSISLGENKFIDFIPSSLFYPNTDINREYNTLGLDTLSMMMKDDIRYMTILYSFIKKIESDYDYILFDCPPSNNNITKSAFLLSDYYAIPTVLDGISTNGVKHYINVVNNIYNEYCGNSVKNHLYNKHFFGNKPKLVGIFFTLIRGQVNYDTDRSDFEEAITANYIENDIYIFDNYIDNYIDIARQTNKGEISTKGRYDELTDEFIERLNELNMDSIDKYD